MKGPVEHVKRPFRHMKTFEYSAAAALQWQPLCKQAGHSGQTLFLCRKLGCVVIGNWGKRFISHESLLAFAPTSSFSCSSSCSSSSCSSSSCSSCYLSRTLAVASCRVLFAVEDASPHVNGYLVLSRHVERLLRSLYDPCTSAFRIPSQHFHKISKKKTFERVKYSHKVSMRPSIPPPGSAVLVHSVANRLLDRSRSHRNLD